jgi:hypothetical protein
MVTDPPVESGIEVRVLKVESGIGIVVVGATVDVVTGQYVVVNVSVMVVLSTTYVLVPVEVTVVLALVKVVVVLGVGVGVGVDVVLDSTIGVQLGRVNVGEFPDPP